MTDTKKINNDYIYVRSRLDCIENGDELNFNEDELNFTCLSYGILSEDIKLQLFFPWDNTIIGKPVYHNCDEFQRLGRVEDAYIEDNHIDVLMSLKKEISDKIEGARISMAYFIDEEQNLLKPHSIGFFTDTRSVNGNFDIASSLIAGGKS